MDTNSPDLERRMKFEQARTAAEREYLKNPTDSDNLTIWGKSLLELSQYETIDDSRKMVREAISKLEEALTINPVKHEALWCLGNAHTTNAFLTSNYDEAKIIIDDAFQCYQKAVDESPENKEYLKSLAAWAKIPALHREIHGGLAKTSNVLDTDAPQLERRMLLEDVRMTAERDYLKNPTDTQNLIRWGGSLVELSQYEPIDDTRKMLREAVSILEEALTIDPAKHKALWHLGYAYTYSGELARGYSEAKLLYDEAFQRFQKAVDEAQASRKEIDGELAKISNLMDKNEPQFERRMLLEVVRLTAERDYLKNPTDADNIIRWGGSLVQLSQCESINIDDERKMLREAVSKLEEALTINPAKHQALWYLGYAHKYCGYCTRDYDEAKLLFDEAFQCFKKAVDQCPEDEIYLQALAECAKARSSRGDKNAPQLERRMLWEDVRMTAERYYLKNPTDTDNLIGWSKSLVKLSEYGPIDDKTKMLKDAMSKLEEAVIINPTKHEALWNLGYFHTYFGYRTRDYDEANLLFDEAFKCFKKAVEESPEDQSYIRSLAECAEARTSHREIYGGPAATSNATGSAMLKNDLCGWVILAVGFLAWIGMVILLMDIN